MIPNIRYATKHKYYLYITVFMLGDFLDYILSTKHYSPVADSLVLNTSAVIVNDDGLLRTSESISDPPSSSILYVD